LLNPGVPGLALFDFQSYTIPGIPGKLPGSLSYNLLIVKTLFTIRTAKEIIPQEFARSVLKKRR